MWLNKQKDAKAKLTRWSLLLQEFFFSIEHCPGKNTELADFLSRHPTEKESRQPISEERMFLPETGLVVANITPIELHTRCRQAQR